MSHAHKQHNVLLRGKVIETYEQEGKTFANVHVNSCNISLEMVGIEEAHLGDDVVIEADISFKRAKKTLNRLQRHKS